MKKKIHKETEMVKVPVAPIRVLISSVPMKFLF